MNKKAFVLIVEDNPGNRELTARQLSILGYEAESVSGGAEAIAVVERDPPALILMDFNMPGLNGLETSRAIRALPGGGSVPIIAVTADTSEATGRAFLEAGANDVIHRPVLLDDLRVVVDRWIGPVVGRSPGGSAPGVLSRLRGDVGEETVQRIVALYLGSLEERTAAISAAVRSGDAGALRNAAHSLRSATSVFDAAEVSDACAKLEALGDSGSLQDADTHLQQLLRCTAELRALLEPVQGATGQSPPDSIIR